LEGDPATTDVIVEKEDGVTTHYYIDDDHPAIVYIKVGGTVRVKRSSAFFQLKSAAKEIARA